MALPLRIRPIAGEPPQGTLLRLATRHRETNAHQFATRIGCSFGDIVRGRGNRALAEATGIGEAALDRHAPKIEPKTRTVVLADERLPFNDWSTARRRWCPDCLLGDRRYATMEGRDPSLACWHRFAWDVRSIRTCPTHRVELTAACPACGAIQGWRGPALDRCRCGSDLAFAGTPRVDRRSGLACRYVAGRLGAAERVRIALLDDSPLNSVLAMLARLGEAALVGHLDAKRGASAPNSTSRDVGIRIVCAWPRSFRRLLDELLASRKPDAVRKGMMGAYGWTFTWITRLPDSALATELRREMAGHAHRHGVVPSGEPLFGATRSDVVTLTKAMRSLGMGLPALHARLREMSALPEGIRRGVSAPIEKEDLQALRDRLAARLGVVETAKHLRIGRSQTRSLLDSALLESTPGAGTYRFVELADVESFMRRLTEVRPLATSTTRLTPLPKACQRQRVDLVTAIGALLGGKLATRAHVRGKGLHGIMVVGSELRALRPTEGVSVEVAAARMGVNPEAARHLARTGVLERLPNGGVANLALSSIEEFRRRHVTGVELAKAVGISPRCMGAILSEMGVPARFGPPTCRQVIYERSGLPRDWRELAIGIREATPGKSRRSASRRTAAND